MSLLDGGRSETAVSPPLIICGMYQYTHNSDKRQINTFYAESCAQAATPALYLHIHGEGILAAAGGRFPAFLISAAGATGKFRKCRTHKKTTVTDAL